MSRSILAWSVVILVSASGVGCQELENLGQTPEQAKQEQPPADDTPRARPGRNSMGPGVQPAPENAPDPEPRASGSQLTIWGARMRGPIKHLEVNYRVDKEYNLLDSEKYDSGTYYLIIHSGSDRFQVPYRGLAPKKGNRGVFEVTDDPFAILYEGSAFADGARIYVERRKDSFQQSGTRVSNIITLKRKDFEDWYGPGVAGGGPGAAEQLALRAESTPSLGLGSDVDRSWRAMIEEFGEDKVVVVKLSKIEDVDAGAALVERATRLEELHDGLRASVQQHPDAVVVILTPQDDPRDTAALLNLGEGVALDAQRRVVTVAADAGLFPKNRWGIAEDFEHPDFFQVNYDLMQQGYPL